MSARLTGLAVVLALGCSGAVSPEVPPAPEDSQPKDILLIVLDTTRADAISLGRSERATTRQIDAIAEVP